MTIVISALLGAVLIQSPPTISLRRQTVGPYILFNGSGFSAPMSLRMPVPSSWALPMGIHVGTIIDKWWARGIHSQDLDHGHLLFKPGWTCSSPCTLGKVMDGVTAVLYHTAENAGRWAAEGEQGIPIDRRTPRSLVGWRMGRVETAVGLVWQQRHELPNYDSNGTVFNGTLATERPDLFTNIESIPLRMEWYGSTLACGLSEQFVVNMESDGRFRFPDGRAFDVFLVCIGPSGILN